MRALIALLLLVPVLAAPAQAQALVSQYKTILPHLVFGGGWHNRFMFVNYTGNPVSVRLSFYGDNGSALTVALSEPHGRIRGVANCVDVDLAGYGARMLETNESSSAALSQGWAVADCGSATCANVAIYGVFATAEVADYLVFEATVFAGDSRSTMAVFPFDNRNSFVTGVAIATHTCAAANPDVRIDFKYADDSGNMFYQYQVSMPCPGHASFTLASFNPISQDRLGYVEVFSNSASVSAIALLFNPKGRAHTTIPVSEYIP